MRYFKTVLRFAWHYMRPYWTRLVAGFVFGCLCGTLAASFIWATRTLAERLQPAPAPPAIEQGTDTVSRDRSKTSPSAKPAPGLGGLAFTKRWAAEGNAFKARAHEVMEEWLPRSGVTFTWRRLLGGLLLLPLLAGLRGTADYLSNYCMAWVSERVIADLRYDVLEKLTSLSLDYFTASTTGDMLTRINGDTAALHRALRQGCADVVKELFTMASVLAYLFWADPTLTLVICFFVPLISFPLFILGKKARRAGRIGRLAGVGQTSMLVEALGGIRVIKAFNLERRQLDRFRALAKEMIHQGMKGVQAKELSTPIIEVIGALGIGALVMYLFWSNKSVEYLVGFVVAVGYFFNSVKKISAVHILFEQAGPGVDRVVDLLQENPTVVEPAVPKTLPTFQNGIRFENVSFSYGREMVLRNVSLELPRGFRLGVAGESGSGKSTLINLLYRFYDVTGGAVTLDGVDIRELSFGDLRRHMALVSQDVFIFRATVAENIIAGNLHATRAEVEAAGRAAKAHDFIMQLPLGYDTVIGERGMTLSGGQRQRLAIARAFVRNAPILVLDEATASLDSHVEAEVQATIDRLEENRTVICIAHRLSTLASMDRIVVLSKGEIVEQGSFDDLVRAGGTFARMAAQQGIFAKG